MSHKTQSELYEEHQHLRFGSARFADDNEIDRAGLRSDTGSYLGLCPTTGLPYRREFSSITTIAGAQSGKGRDGLIADLLTDRRSTLVYDRKGENAAITLAHQIQLGKAAYCINPKGQFTGPPWFLPMHRFNPLDILTPHSATLNADASAVMEMLIALSGDSRAEVFETTARRWCKAIVLWLIERFDRVVTLPELYSVISIMYGNPGYWDQLLGGHLLNSGHTSVRVAAGEMREKRAHAYGEFSGVALAINNSLNFLDDENIAYCLSGADFSLNTLSCEPATVYDLDPDGCAPLSRMIFGVAALYKLREPGGHRVVLNIDEAAHLGKFEFLEEALTLRQGQGLVVNTYWQSIGQIKQIWGAYAEQIFLSSSVCTQLFGIRDYETAKMTSDMLGHQTISFANAQLQDRIAQLKADLFNSAARGEDPAEFEVTLRHLLDCADQCARPLQTPDEILCLPENRKVLFCSGLDCPPILAAKSPYYTQVSLRGSFLPNPFYPPKNAVPTVNRQGRLELRRLRIENVPDELCHWPQYQQQLRAIVV